MWLAAMTVCTAALRGSVEEELLRLRRDSSKELFDNLASVTWNYFTMIIILLNIKLKISHGTKHKPNRHTCMSALFFRLYGVT